jgi:DNA/RNA endonuclease YhcR with UshA esterase domain
MLKPILLLMALFLWQEPAADAAKSGAAPAEATSAQEEIPTVEPADALNHVDKKVTVKFEVLSSKLLKDQKLCFLNSKKNHRDPDDFAVVIKEKGLELFDELKVDDPAKYFLGKTIAVTGTVQKFRGKAEIVVDSVDQIRVVVVTPAAGEGAPKANANSGETPPADDDGR